MTAIRSRRAARDSLATGVTAIRRLAVFARSEHFAESHYPGLRDSCRGGKVHARIRRSAGRQRH